MEKRDVFLSTSSPLIYLFGNIFAKSNSEAGPSQAFSALFKELPESRSIRWPSLAFSGCRGARDEKILLNDSSRSRCTAGIRGIQSSRGAAGWGLH